MQQVHMYRRSLLSLVLRILRFVCQAGFIVCLKVQLWERPFAHCRVSTATWCIIPLAISPRHAAVFHLAVGLRVVAWLVWSPVLVLSVIVAHWTLPNTYQNNSVKTV